MWNYTIPPYQRCNMTVYPVFGECSRYVLEHFLELKRQKGTAGQKNYFLRT